MSEKRKFIRHDAIHLLDYLVIDSDGQTGLYSMGRTLDVSHDGLKLETTTALRPGTHLLITVGLEDQLVDLAGTIIHCQTRGGRFVAGIAYDQVSAEDRRILSLYINAFKTRATA